MVMLFGSTRQKKHLTRYKIPPNNRYNACMSDYDKAF